MSSAIYFRIFGYVTTLALHGVNALVMVLALQGEIVMKDPDIKNLAAMQMKFLTIWNVIFLMIYSGLGFICDTLTLMNKDYMLPKPISQWRHIMFASLVYPVTMLVFMVFWPLYLYDRNIVFPEYIDKVLSQKSNYVMHISIVPIVIWELVFQPRSAPKSHKINIHIILLYFIVYNSVIFYTHAKTGLWPYPILASLYGTIYFPTLLLCVLMLTIFNYYNQWTLTKLFWGTNNVKGLKIK